MGKQVGLEQGTNLHGMTAYGGRIGPHSGVVIMNANWNKQILVEKAEKAPDHKKMEYGKYEIHSWTMHKGTKGAAPDGRGACTSRTSSCSVAARIS